MGKGDVFLKTIGTAVTGGLNVFDLARTYKVPFENGKSQAGCPGIMNPLTQQPEIEFSWGLSSNTDKNYRFQELSKALKVYNTYATTGGKIDQEAYLELGIHGRVMLNHIAEKNLVNNNKVAEFHEAIKPFAHKNFDIAMKDLKDTIVQGKNGEDTVPFGKGGCTVEAIYNFYMGDKVGYFPVANKVEEAVEALQEDANSIFEKIKAENKDWLKYAKDLNIEDLELLQGLVISYNFEPSTAAPIFDSIEDLMKIAGGDSN